MKGWKKALLLPTIPSAVPHEREYVGKNNIKSSCENEGIFLIFW
jgi:hypothetical protein